LEYRHFVKIIPLKDEFQKDFYAEPIMFHEWDETALFRNTLPGKIPVWGLGYT
jgi:hypothetical protein